MGCVPGKLLAKRPELDQENSQKESSIVVQDADPHYAADPTNPGSLQFNPYNDPDQMQNQQQVGQKLDGENTEELNPDGTPKVPAEGEEEKKDAEQEQFDADKHAFRQCDINQFTRACF